ncbi:MAG: hypothetical protein MPN21_15345 [Thermoanaerobaculia bacterium]|nr:hypothetical protein [Thermoanaerobaculia bacterium]
MGPMAPSRLRAAFTGAVLALSWTVVPATAQVAVPAVVAYEQLQAGEYGPPVELPEGGLELTVDVGTWHFEAGTVRSMRPVDLGSPLSTGVVFEGRGRFQLNVPDAVELAHLRRSIEDETVDRLDVEFDRMVFRFTQREIAQAFDFAASSSSFASDPLAAERHEHWLERRRQDLDARVVAALLSEGDAYFRAAMRTEDHDWIEFGFDGLEGEELFLAVYRSRNGFVEEWVRLDRAGDRRPDGRPKVDSALRLDLQHLDVTADLTTASKTLSPLGKGEIQPRLARFDVESRWVARRHLGQALSLLLTPLATVQRVERISAEGGVELPFLRYQLDKPRSLLSEEYNDWQLVVVLDEPVMAGEEFTLRFHYQLEVLNYVSGTEWHPGEQNAIVDRGTAELHLLTRKKDEVRSMGTVVVDGEEADGGKRWHYRIERPARMVTFSFAETFHEETVEADGVPAVTAFANYGGRKARSKAFNVAADLSNSIAFFQQIFRQPLAVDHLYATAIYGGHGQSFDGFLHLSEETFQLESKGPSELFRAHEAAHQWWGHAVAPATYRDQWLAEAFAEYSAILFLQFALEDGQEVYDEIIEAYSSVVRGRFSKGSKFLRGWAMQDNDKFRRRIGPIGLGYRASTSETPAGYFSQTYVKGAVVLHMLRTCLRSLTRSDETFFRVLQDFLDSYSGGSASTADFIRVLERHAPGSWGWFFDQWIQGTAIPTYRWHHDVVEEDGKLLLKLDIEQIGVPEGFRMPVPLQLQLRGGETVEVVVMVDEPRKQISLELAARPRRVTLNANHGVLAAVESK